MFSYSSWLWSHRVYHHGRDRQTLLVKKGTNRNKYSHPYQMLVLRLESSNLSSFYSLVIKILVPPLLLSEMGHSSLKQLMKISNNKMSQFSREFKKSFWLWSAFLQECTTDGMKGCCRQRRLHGKEVEEDPFWEDPSCWTIFMGHASFRLEEVWLKWDKDMEIYLKRVLLTNYQIRTWILKIYNASILSYLTSFWYIFKHM